MQIDPHLREFGFTCDIPIYARRLSAAVKFAERFPDQPFFVDHITKPGIEGEQSKILGETDARFTV
jgi:L-fuconolactonase